MRKTLLLLIILGLYSFGFSQSPQTFKYQTVVRDASGDIQSNKIIAIKASLLKGSPTGIVVFAERHSTTTNDFGVCALNIGEGSLLSGSFSSINWGVDTYFLKIELDINGGTTYIFMGTSQILSVPYALYAAKSGQSATDHDTSATNELQTLSLNANNLSISNGNTVVLPPDFDHDTLNELQIISKTGNTISLSKSGGSVTDSDNQTLSLVGNQLQISNGNGVVLSGVIDLDADPTNELQSLSYSNDTLHISQTNYAVLSSVPSGTCINSVNIVPPLGYTYSGNTSSTDPTWSFKTKMPDSIFGAAYATLNGRVYVFGGFSTLTLNSTYVYDISTDTWSMMAPLPTKRYFAVAEVVNNKIYVIGGFYSGSALNVVEEYDPATDTWATKTPMTTARYDMVADVVNNKIYVIGGAISAGTAQNIVEMYDPATNVWATKTPMSNARYAHCSASYNNKIFVFGGFASNYVNYYEVYDVVSNTWPLLGNLPVPKKSASACLFNDKIYLIGGNEGSVVTGNIQEYNPVNDTWAPFYPAMSTKRTYAALGSNNTSIFVIGGRDFNSDPTWNNEELRLPIKYYIHCKN